MANIDKQLIARIPMGKSSEFILDYRKDWGIPIKKVWDKKEVERIIFCLSDGEGVFECSKNIANKIMEETENIFNNNKINIEEVSNIKIYITRGEGLETDYHIGINVNDLPRHINVFSKMWSSIRKTFK